MRTTRWLAVLAVVGVCGVAIALVLRATRTRPPAHPPDAATPVAAASAAAAAPNGPELYANYCAACHGDTGDGNGPAARFLYPRPRNFRDAKFRLVSSVNRVPCDDDLMRVIERGMPGSAMFPFAHLPEPERRTLVAHVRHLTRTGVEQRLRQGAEELGDVVDAVELARDVDLVAKPGAAIEPPSVWPDVATESAAHGRALYLKQCAACHGETGKGDGVQDQRDDDGTPTRPRDYTRGIFKGGRDRAQLYARIVLGMPGTPMPSSSNFQPDEIADLIYYIQSLSPPDAQAAVEHKRSRLLARALGNSMPDEIPDAAWDSAEPVPIVVSPLWWRAFEDFDLRVQAVHDASSIAIRLSWRDPTCDQRSVRPQDFKDMVAVQLFAGEREPFLGMGASGGSVDVWVWEADRQADLVAYADVDTAYPNMAVDLYPFEQPADGPRAHATERQPKQFLTAWAVGNLRSDPERRGAASALQAKGFGSLSMRPRPSQSVTSAGHWSDGRWTVVLRRPLAPPDGSGIRLAPGDKVSIAFAVWDGSAGDRNGQKLVSIWHDLVVE